MRRETSGGPRRVVVWWVRWGRGKFLVAVVIFLIEGGPLDWYKERDSGFWILDFWVCVYEMWDVRAAGAGIVTDGEI